MPKILEDIKNKFTDYAEHVLMTEGYDKLSIRGLAAKCNTATGTIYNYYKSKDEIVATIISRDWKKTIDAMKQVSESADCFPDGYVGLYRELISFSGRYAKIWGEFSKKRSTYAAIKGHHLTLRNQLTEYIGTLLERNGMSTASANILAETLIAVSGQKDIDEASVRSFAERIK